MLDSFVTWLRDQLTWEGALVGVGLFVATFVGSILLVGFLLVKLPADYFQDSHRREPWGHRHPVLRWLGIIAKNLMGVALVGVGVLMLIGPGQGILTILIGVMLLDFPGKRQLERKLISRPKILGTINRLRARYGKPPLVLEEQRTETPR